MFVGSSTNTYHAMNAQANFEKAKASIANRRNLLGEAVWNHLTNDDRAMVAVEECARQGANFYAFIKWSEANNAR